MRKLFNPDQADSRRNILERLKKAEAGKPSPTLPLPGSSFLHQAGPNPVESFATCLAKVNGTAILCPDSTHVAEKLAHLVTEYGWKNIVCPDSKMSAFLKDRLPDLTFSHNHTPETEVIITGCEALVAETGSVMVSSAQTGGRQAFVYGPVHVVMAGRHQLLETGTDAMETILARYDEHLPSFISSITGPSRTADIEKTLILGAHGPRSLFVLVSLEENDL